MYREDAVFDVGLWAEEHSAQLEAIENTRLQRLFEVGARNVLSATTTLEVGIDIGGLCGVLLGNVPPGRANYHNGRAAPAAALMDLP
jgi:DEAD/DEAH box helicase domain-containing protein